MDYKKIITWISIVGSIASLVGLIYVFYPNKDKIIKMDFIVSSCDNLTVFNNVSEPEIKAQFEFKGNKISKLWRLNVKMQNASERTIIGNGQLKNIMFDKLVFFIKNDYQIIDKKLIRSDFSHSLTIIGNDTINLSFSQWRAGEKLEYSFYITTKSNVLPGIDIFYQPKDRQIVDGDIVFLREIQQKEQELVTNKLGKPTKKVVYVLFITLISLILIVFIIIIVSNPVGYTKRKYWKKYYLNDYNEHIKKQYVKNKNLSDELINHPELYGAWNSYNGEKYPKEWGFDFGINKMLSLLTTTMVFIVLCFVQVVVLIDLIQQFP